MSQQFSTREVPPQALRCSIPAQFAAKAAGADGLIPFTMLARSAEPVDNWYFGAVYHDFEGMQRADVIAIDYCHDDGEIIGKGDKFTIKKDGLHVAGDLTPLTDNPEERANQVKGLADKGVPWEASIDFRGSCLAEEVPAGRVAQVNGRKVEGPALIFREWPLRRVAICPSGMDQNTTSQFTADDAKPVILRTFQTPHDGGSMSVKSTQTPAADGQQPTTHAVPAQQGTAPPNPAAGSPDAGNGGGALTPNPATAPAGNRSETFAAFTAEMNRFTAKFGAVNGAKWFSEGKTFSEALELSHEDLGRQLAAKDGETAKLLAAKDEKITQLEAKLSALHTGEKNPAKLSQTDAADQPADQDAPEAGQFSHLGKIGKFASAIQIPGNN